MMEGRTLHLEECVPVACVADGAILARDGALTLGWELYPGEEYSVTEELYDTASALLASALRALPEWTMVHKQDLYRRRRYHSERSGHFLDDCFSAHFEGRPYLEHRQYLWLTFNPAIPGRAGAMKGALQGAAGGIRYRSPEMGDLGETLRRFGSRCEEFIATLCSGGACRARRITQEELEGVPGGEDGLLQEYLRWWGSPLEGTDIIQREGTYLDRDSRRLFSHSIASADDLPGELTSTVRVRTLSSPEGEIVLSAGSVLGSALPHEHLVNTYWLVPSQGYALRELEARRRGMMSMSRGSAENSVRNACPNTATPGARDSMANRFTGMFRWIRVRSPSSTSGNAAPKNRVSGSRISSDRLRRTKARHFIYRPSFPEARATKASSKFFAPVRSISAAAVSRATSFPEAITPTRSDRASASSR